MKLESEQVNLDKNRAKNSSTKNSKSSVESLRKNIQGLDSWFENLEKPLTLAPDILATTNEPKVKPQKPKKRKHKKSTFIKLSSDDLNMGLSNTKTERKILSLKLGNGIELEFWQ
jgi:hypothetical protein